MKPVAASQIPEQIDTIFSRAAANVSIYHDQYVISFLFILRIHFVYLQCRIYFIDKCQPI
jgi:hypothetical protein